MIYWKLLLTIILDYIFNLSKIRLALCLWCEYIYWSESVRPHKKTSCVINILYRQYLNM